MANIINQFGQIKVGFRSTQVVNSIDTDAQAFITAANITDSTQQSAINTLVTQLKTYGIWTKLKAVYPFVGGTASSHKFNLKDPRDLDAAYRLVFNGGWTHTSTGAQPNGTTGYARTFLIPKTTFGRNISNTGDNALIHVSKYSRTNQTITSNYWLEGVYSLKTGGGTSGFNPADLVFLNHSFSTQYQGSSSTTIGGVDPNASIYGFSNNTQGYFLFTRTSNNMFRTFRNNNLVGTNTYDVTTSVETPQTEYLLGARNDSWNNHFNPFGYNPLENSFTSIGDGLTDAEAANFYTAVQTFQTTLGRQVGVPIVADSDAQAFLNAAVITNQTQANAINTLVTSLKSANIWTKMKAIYPFVGGTATTHKFNLKDPRDLDAAYRLVFNGGWTHSATGALPNGTTAYANTYLNPYVVFGGGNSLLPTDSTHQLVHISKYSRTNSSITDNFDGVYTGGYPSSCWLSMGWNSGWSPTGFGIVNTRSATGSYVTLGNRTDGFFVVNRDGYTSLKSFRNSTLVSTNSVDAREYNQINQQLNLNPQNVYLIGALNTAYDFTFRPLSYNNHETAFQSIGTSLTDAEATAFYNAVQAYQTTLGRQV